MRVVTPDQMKRIDKMAMEYYGIPGSVLMENAGSGVAREILKLSGGRSRVVMFAGKGNNGGDVMVAARHLINNRLQVRVFLIGEWDSLSGDAADNACILKRMGVTINEISSSQHLDTVKAAIEWGDIMVDGIFGTGLRGPVKGTALEIIRLINAGGKTTVAVDIPSGVDGERGAVCGDCVAASVTVTFGYPKSGLLQYPGAQHVGRLVVEDISIPRATADRVGVNMLALTGEYVSALIPERRPDTHKGSYGRAAVVGGSEGMTGAVVLACLGCIRSGAGLVKAALPGGLHYVMETGVIEAMSVSLGQGAGLKADDDTRDELQTIFDWADAVALGPGMGADDDRVKVVEFVLKNVKLPLVLDADALNCLSMDLDMLKNATGPVIITPHPGEMSRLTRVSTAEIQRDRIKAAREFAQKWGTITVLKGANSVIADPKGNIYINISGNPGMASGGMGDVLTGMITSFIAQGLEPVRAACAAVYIHGTAGDLMAQRQGVYGLNASGLAGYIPAALRRTKGW